MADPASAKVSKQDIFDENSSKSTMLFPMDEGENLDLINDETFGSGSFESGWIDTDEPDAKVDEFEEWKRQQKSLSNKQIPLEEAPARIQDEEKMTQAISKLENINIQPLKQEADMPLPNAQAIEALWPTSPKHSSNIVSPDHSPYNLSDLLSPTHNIWGSPTSEEQNSSDEKDNLSGIAKNHVDAEENRKLYSPVLEDEAIVSALPKRVAKPIRVQEIEKMGFGHPVNQNRPQFANDARAVRPPPGFPPSMNPRSPFPIHSTPYLRSPMPPVPPNVSMAQAQAQAMYAAMLNQRMMYPSPLLRTPPPPHGNFVRPHFHSDPAHLGPRPLVRPNPQQHGRFITPQPRNNWNNTRGNRSYDNRRRQQNFSESPTFKYVPQYYVGSEDEDEDDAGALMTAKEKDWIIKVQLMQLTSDKPELDDYYFHTFERRRLAKERSQATTGVEPETNNTNKDIEMTLPHVTKAEHNYKPTKFEGSLGQVSVGSVFHPREVVQVGDSGKPRGPVGSLKETKKKYQLLLTIEKGFDQILPIEDLERMALQVPHDVRPQLRERRERLCQKCFDLLDLRPSKDSNKRYDDDTLLQMLAVRKGRRFVCKVLRIVREKQRNQIALAITRNLRIFTKKDIHHEETESLCASVVDVIKCASSENLVEHHEQVVGADGNILHLFGSKFTLRILAVLLKRMSELLKNIDENSLQLQTIWLSFLSVACRDFVTSSPKVLVKNINDVRNVVDVLCNNVEEDKILNIQEHFRLVENAQTRSPQR